MTKQEQAAHISQQLQAGLETANENMLAFKRYKQTPVVIVRDGQVVAVSPDELPAASKAA